MDSESVFIPDIHIGNLISDYIKRNKLSKAELSRNIGVHPANLNTLLKRKSMNTDRLVDISKSLDYVFFIAWTQEPVVVPTFLRVIEKPASVGKLIENRMDELSLTQADLAGKLGVTQQEVNRFLKKTSFDTDKLATLSRLLNYNFFKEFYVTYDHPEDRESLGFRVTVDILYHQMERELKKYKAENDALKAENDALKEKIKELGG